MRAAPSNPPCTIPISSYALREREREFRTRESGREFLAPERTRKQFKIQKERSYLSIYLFTTFQNLGWARIATWKGKEKDKSVESNENIFLI